MLSVILTFGGIYVTDTYIGFISRGEYYSPRLGKHGQEGN